jgi:hypothetical protein
VAYENLYVKGGSEMELDGTKFNHSDPGNAEAKRIDEEKDDRAMILWPLMWPKWPYLPVKRWVTEPKFGGRDLECGILWTGTGFNIYLVNLFLMPKTPEEFKATEHHAYDNVDDLLKDGWIVD